MPEFRVFVFSLPRSGSSMMTGICERLGVSMKYTTEDADEIARRERMEEQRYGKDGYRQNPEFKEISRNQFKHWMDIAQTPYSGCKVIVPVNDMRWDAVVSVPSKVILMWRDPSEILQSQEACYNGRARVSYTGPDDQEPWEIAEAHLRTMHAQAQMTLESRKEASNAARFGAPDTAPFDFRIIKYRDVLADPKKEIGKIAQWIQADPGRVDYAVAAVDASKIRFKAEELDKGV